MRKNDLKIKDDLTRLTESEIIDWDLKIFEAIKQHSLAELGWWGVDTIADRHNLELFVEFFKTFAVLESGLHHGIREMLNCYERAYYDKLSDTERRARVVAALFHNFQCIDKLESSASKLERALIGLDLAQKYASSSQLGLTSEEFELARVAVIQNHERG